MRCKLFRITLLCWSIKNVCDFIKMSHIIICRICLIHSVTNTKVCWDNAPVINAPTAHTHTPTVILSIKMTWPFCLFIIRTLTISAVWSLKIDIIENKIYLIQNSAAPVAFLALCLQYRVRRIEIENKVCPKCLKFWFEKIYKSLSIYTVYTRPWFKNQKSITKFLAWIGTHSYLVLFFLLFIINAIACGYLKKVQNQFHPSSLVSKLAISQLHY